MLAMVGSWSCISAFTSQSSVPVLCIFTSVSAVSSSASVGGAGSCITGSASGKTGNVEVRKCTVKLIDTHAMSLENQLLCRLETSERLLEDRLTVGGVGCLCCMLLVLG